MIIDALTDGPLSGLSNYAQFILWTVAERDGKRVKLPVSPTTYQVCNANDPAEWVTAEDAIKAARSFGKFEDPLVYGIGFVFTTSDDLFFIDIDHALSEDGLWSDTAQDMLRQFPGAAVEVSHSGKGLHIFGRGNIIPHSNKNIPLGLEYYTEGRYVALTGDQASGDINLDFTAHLAIVTNHYFPPTKAESVTWSYEPVQEWAGIEDDSELIHKALDSASAAALFKSRATLRQLWENDVDALSMFYPDGTGNREYDASSADAALAQHLAFWTGNNCDRILRLMQMSGLTRDKWQREDYLTRTILRAASLQTTWHGSGTNVTITRPVDQASNATLVNGLQYMVPAQQVEYFSGCVYIRDIHRVFTPDGSLLRPEQFRAVYGGYIFTLDANNDKTTKNAFEAFTESQAVRYPKAASTCFRPMLAPGQLIQEESRTLANIYVPVYTERKTGDPSRFLIHLAKVLPDPKDQLILISYMAACVQHQGYKFQWAPLLQGTEGNGKTLFTRCVAFAIGRRYTHYPKASDLDNKFNGWILGKTFIGVEDVFVPDHRREIIETLKPMITAGDGLEIQLKGLDQFTADICANFMLNSNHKDAIRKTLNDRRFAVFFTAQQSYDDIQRDGMGGNYFPALYDWLRAEGYAIVAKYLAEYQISQEYNPALPIGICHRAPETSTTGDVIAVSLGGVEQEILEAIDAEVTGFCGGWISSIAVEKLLQRLGLNRRIPINKRRDMLIGLGYDWHPALKNGRVNNNLNIDGGKPRLFIQKDHAHRQIINAADVAKTYVTDQQSAIK